MRPTIYFLEDKIGNGKPKVIQGLINRMFFNANDLELIIRPLDIKDDLVCIVETRTITIGLMSHENKNHSSSDLIRFLHGENCSLIFCTSVTGDDLTKVVAGYVSKGHYQSVFLKSIWSPHFEINELLTYEVCKLEEIISMHLGYTFLKDECEFDTDPNHQAKAV
jgi:hypothetical protein